MPSELLIAKEARNCDLCFKRQTKKYQSFPYVLLPRFHAVKEREEGVIEIFICRYCQAIMTRRRNRFKLQITGD